MYEGVRDESHLLELLDRTPPWDFFEYSEVTDQLFHLNGYSHLLKKYKPQSVEDLAMVLAIIRPSKAYLQQCNWDKIRKEVWIMDSDRADYSFKKSHALSYSLAVIVHLNLKIEQMSKE
jgi:DNA polymerase III alpha subunit